MTISNQEKRLQVLNMLSLIAVMAVNALAVLLPINDYQTGEISDLYPNLFTPAGITFSIWGLIYLTLILFIIYQARGLISSRVQRNKIINRIGYLFLISSLANIGWILAWHHLKIGLSFVIMLILLITLLSIYNRLERGRSLVSKQEDYFVYLPFSLYTAWITVATLANLTVLIVDLNWYGSFIPAQLWTIVMIALAVGIAVYIYLNRQDLFFNLVIIWALIGILIKRVSIAEELVVSVSLAAAIGILVIIGNIIYQKLFRDFSTSSR